MEHKTDILAIGIHPDDVELGCGGTLLTHAKRGYSIAICDLTCGEMGTRGSGALRLIEAENAAKTMGVSERINLNLSDVWAEIGQESILKIIEAIRYFRPRIILSNATRDRHPDHAKGNQLVSKAAFIAGLPKVETVWQGENQAAWRPKAVYSYVQSRFLEPDLVVDISGFMEEKMAAIQCYKSQFYDPESDEPATFISDKEFLEMVKAQNQIYGKPIGVQFAEAFVTERYLGVGDLFDLI